MLREKPLVASLLSVALMLLVVLLLFSLRNQLYAFAQGAVRLTDIFYFFVAPRPSEPLPEYFLEIKPKDLQGIIDALPVEPPSYWKTSPILTQEFRKEVKGIFRVGGEEYEVKVSVRGDLPVHWSDRKKSWRIQFPKDKFFHPSTEARPLGAACKEKGILSEWSESKDILLREGSGSSAGACPRVLDGMRTMDLIIPEDRSWFVEQFNNERAKELGLLVPPSWFATLRLNGSEPMLYFAVEQWGKEFLEKQKRPGDTNFYKSDTSISAFGSWWDPSTDDVAYAQRYTRAAGPPVDSVAEYEEYLKLLQPQAHEQPGFRERVQRLFDLQNIITLRTHALLTGGGHATNRFLFNVWTGKFEFIPWDIGVDSPTIVVAGLWWDPFFREVFSVPEWRLQLLRRVWEYVSDEEKETADRERIDTLIVQIERAAYRDSSRLMSAFQVRRQIRKYRSLLLAQFPFLKQQLSLAEVMLTQRIPVSRPQGPLLTIDATVRGVSPASIRELSMPPDLAALMERGDVTVVRDDGNGVLDAADRVIPVRRGETIETEVATLVVQDELQTLLSPSDPVWDGTKYLPPPHVRVRFFLRSERGTIPPFTAPIKITVQNAVTGERANVISEVTVDERTFARLPESWVSRSEFLRRNPAFRASGGRGVTLAVGVHTFREDVIIPAGLSLEVPAGTTLQFASGASLFSYSPVHLRGLKNAPVRIQGIGGGKWGVVALITVPEESTVSWAEFENGSDAFMNGAYFRGMLSAHAAPLRVEDSAFRAAYGDDAINVKYARTTILRSLFERNSFDGVDLDFESGEVAFSRFIENGNDAIDASGGVFTIREIEVQGSGDKCLSIGEEARVEVLGSTLEGCAIGVAVKDGSEATVRDTKIIGNDVGVASYIKKPIFGHPKATFENVTFEGNGKLTDISDEAEVTFRPPLP